MRRFPHVPLILLTLLIVPAACSEDGSGSNLAVDAAADIPEVLEYRFEALTDITLENVMHVGAFSCRDDALFLSVGAAEETGIYKMDLDAPDLGWRQIYHQEAVLCPTADALAVVLPPGKT